jgi:hypothetical protein
MRIALILLIAIASSVTAQDMPLFTIFPSGTTWEKQGKPAEEANPMNGLTLEIDPRRSYQTMPDKPGLYLTTTEGSKILSEKIDLPFEPVGGLAVIHNNSTLVVAESNSQALWAFAIQKDGKLKGGNRYFSLRHRKVDGKPQSADPSILIADEKDRIFAVTNLGVQVFDPTGRLCGVLPLPAKGKVENLFFDRDHPELVTIVIDRQIFTRVRYTK